MTSVGGDPVAIDAIAGLLMLARAFPQRLRAQRQRCWLQLRRDQAPPDLQGQTVLIFGVGRTGRAVARFAQALELRVIGVRCGPPAAGEAAGETQAPSQLAALLPRADWLVLACPHDAQTPHLIDARMLALLPRGAAVISVAHGVLIEESALVAALQSGRVGSAYIAASGRESPVIDSPLRTLPNVMIVPAGAGYTPHCGAP